MAKKSSSQLKVVKENNSLPPIEETWNNAKQSFLNTITVNIDLASRVDNMLNLRDLAFSMLGDNYMWHLEQKSRMELYRKMMGWSVEAYTKVKEAIESWEMSEFLKEDMKDYFDGIIPKADEVEDEIDMLRAAIFFRSVQPYGERMTSLHYTMLDEAKAREK